MGEGFPEEIPFVEQPSRGWNLEREWGWGCYWGSRRNSCAKALWHHSESGLRQCRRQAWLQDKTKERESVDEVEVRWGGQGLGGTPEL